LYISILEELNLIHLLGWCDKDYGVHHLQWISLKIGPGITGRLVKQSHWSRRRNRTQLRPTELSNREVSFSG
jgi:hypothetical protein